MSNDDLAKAIATLGESLPASPAEPQRDLERGRSGLRRQRRWQALAAVTATAVIAGGGYALSHSLGNDTPSTSVAGDPAAAPSGSTAPTPSPTPVPTGRILKEFQRVLATHLDPQWDHLVPRRKPNANEQVCGELSGIVGLGSKYDWRNPGENGLGMLQLMVERHPEKGVSPCGLAPFDSCTPLKDPGTAERAWKVVAGSSIGDVVRRIDGSQVTLTAHPLFGNNSLVPLESMDLEIADLLTAAADPALTLPGLIADRDFAMTTATRAGD